MRSFILPFLICSQFVFSQERNIDLEFIPAFGGSPLVFDSIYITGTDTISVSDFRFYISNAVISTDKGNFPADKNALLADLRNNNNSLVFSIPENAVPISASFSLGIDSLTNVSGAMTDDLDPMHGMYWAWQSGYINVKLEGTSSLSNARNKEFQFHLGGYLSPNSAVRKVVLPVENSESLKIFLPVDAVFQKTDLQKTNHIMRPCSEAVSLSQLLAEQFFTGK